MKLFSKIVSIVLALSCVLSVCLLPVSAASDKQAEAKFTLKKEETLGDEANDVYSLTVSLKAGKYGICMVNMPIVYDKTIFTPSSMTAKGKISYTQPIAGARKFAAAQKLGHYADEDNVFLPNGQIDENANSPITGPASGSWEFLKSVPDNLGTLDQNKYDALYLGFMWDYDVQYIMANGVYEDICEFYFFTDKGTDVSNSPIGVIGDSVLPNVTFELSGKNYADRTIAQPVFQTYDCIVHNANEAAPSKDSVLKRVNTQYKKGEMTADGVQQFQLRTTSSISKADMATLLSVDVTPENIKANVQNIGFVITDDTTVNPEHVRAAINAGGQFTTTGDKTYIVGTTNTLVQTDTDYQFRAMVSVKNKLPADGIKLQSFIDVNGTLTMYADALTLTADKIK